MRKFISEWWDCIVACIVMLLAIYDILHKTGIL